MDSQVNTSSHNGPPAYPGYQLSKSRRSTGPMLMNSFFNSEDTRLTSRKELAGWYSYGFAAEVFVVCGIASLGSFIPITLEQLAREEGFLLHDRSKSCTTNINEPTKFNINSNPAPPRIPADGACVIRILGADINTASFAMYTFSISVFIQALVIVSMSGAADHGRYRKLFLLCFAFTGAIATILFLAVVPKVFLLGGALAIIANVSFGASFVLLNSFLPLLVRHHPQIRHNLPLLDSSSSYRQQNFSGPQNQSDVGVDVEDEDIEEPTEALLRQPLTNQAAIPRSTPISPELVLSTKISSNGIGIGYFAAVIVQLLAVGIIFVTRSITESTTVALRIVMFFIGAWWAFFTIPAALWLRPRPGPPIPSTSLSKKQYPWIGYISYAWKSLLKTILRARHLKDLMLFLGAWFLLSDGIATISGTAVLFAKTQLGMNPAQLAMINVVVTIFGIAGAFSWGYVPFIQRLGVLGLQQSWEMYALGAVYGVVLGGLSSYCRSFFAELIPPGSEAGFYALYAITDKGSSIFGPAIVGAITDRYGEIRPAFAFLAVLIFLPLPLMLLVDVKRGRDNALVLATELGGKVEPATPHARPEFRTASVDDEP
ncbi:MAG: hypothetical protein Q9167_001882 [Letrouitia subvulpina]